MSLLSHVTTGIEKTTGPWPLFSVYLSHVLSLPPGYVKYKFSASAVCRPTYFSLVNTLRLPTTSKGVGILFIFKKIKLSHCQNIVLLKRLK